MDIPKYLCFNKFDLKWMIIWWYDTAREGAVHTLHKYASIKVCPQIGLLLTRPPTANFATMTTWTRPRVSMATPSIWQLRKILGTTKIWAHGTKYRGGALRLIGAIRHKYGAGSPRRRGWCLDVAFVHLSRVSKPCALCSGPKPNML